LSETHLERLTEQTDILTYYAAAGMVVRYLAETYGDDKVFALYQALGNYPFNDIAVDPAWGQHSDERLRAAFQDILNLDMTELSEGYLEWIDLQSQTSSSGTKINSVSDTQLNLVPVTQMNLVSDTQLNLVPVTQLNSVSVAVIYL